MHVLLPPGPRHLLGGIVVALGIVAVFALGKELLSSEPPLPSVWLTEADQEALAESLTLVDVNGWTAACLWEGRSSSDIVTVVDHPKGPARAWEWKAPSGRKVSILVVEGTQPRTGSFDEVFEPGAFCYVPSAE